jgi:hemerythrin-like domain-containing protein
MAEHLGERDLLVRALSEHMEIHRRVLRLRQGLAAGEVPGDELAGLGDLLAAHVRLEEKEIFPLAERAVPADALQHLSFDVRHR